MPVLSLDVCIISALTASSASAALQDLLHLHRTTAFKLYIQRLSHKFALGCERYATWNFRMCGVTTLSARTSCCRLVNEQRQRNADAERLEAQALKARMEARAAADRIQQCQNTLQAAESKLAAKKHEISLKVGAPTLATISLVLCAL